MYVGSLHLERAEPTRAAGGKPCPPLHRPSKGVHPHGRPLSSSAHAGTTQDPVRVCATDGSLLVPAALALGSTPALEHPSMSSTLTVAMISSRHRRRCLSLLNVVRTLGPESARAYCKVRTESRHASGCCPVSCAENIVSYESESDYRDHWDRSEWVEWDCWARDDHSRNNPYCAELATALRWVYSCRNS